MLFKDEQKKQTAMSLRPDPPDKMKPGKIERALKGNRPGPGSNRKKQLRPQALQSRATRGRALLSDEVGLGKTIEALIILTEYIKRE